jgi:small-conductance mechanosensitive channel
MAAALGRGAARRCGAASPIAVVVVAILFASAAAAAQRAPEPSPAQSRDIASAVLDAVPSQDTATVTYFNRSIVDLRAMVLGRGPAERARAATRRLDDLAADAVAGPVEAHALGGGSLISVASKGVLVLTDADLDPVAGDTLQEVTARTVERLQAALQAETAARSLPALLRSVANALGGLAVGLLIVWGLTRANRALSYKLMRLAEDAATKAGLLDLASLRSSRLLEMQRWLVSGIYAALCLVMGYTTIGFALRQFPYTRPWGDSMRGFLIGTIVQIGLGIVNAIPGLFTVVVILLIARFVVRLVTLWFGAVERGQVNTGWVYPETAQPTRRLVTTLLWLFAVVMAYPYFPGSQTEAFKGISVFIGLMLTFGSSGLINHVMSGFFLTYSRALRNGDFVRVGEVEGTVTQLGMLSTKITTLKGEEVTIPNAVIVSQTITDYSRAGDSEGVYTPTSVTIGYDTPWRQVHALLLSAAERTTGVRREPKPVVLQASLEDYYVKYTLFVCLERQQSRPFTLDTLHAHIQDLFNEYGVQIMSPNYMMDPAAPKVVARTNWYAAPAQPGPAPPVSTAQPL